MAKKKFEDALAELEAIVRRLEDEKLPLEEAISLFEEGMKLSRFCSAKLEEAEKKVAVLLKDEQGNSYERPFDDEPESL
ncbi:MAG: exodeoxyribonuclease VII small subunit [Desulfobacterota bacterium]|nr:exodeoxyribonuclease VII small subunit [Thermodesulfobacteriota bacterium]